MSVGGLPDFVNAAFTTLSKAQQDTLAAAPEEMKPFLEAQMKMQKEQELIQLITKMLKGDHEQAMSVIRNIGG
jgi:phosphoenolpyruvate-protein kinase (PTS system EI component)